MTVTGVDLARGPDRCAVWGGPGLIAEASTRWALGLGVAPRPMVRLKLRLSFREWSQGVDRDGLAARRAWLTACETILNAPRIHPDLL